MIIWLASYPKSGNTLLRSILGSYFYSSDGEIKFNDIYKIEQFPAIKHFKDINIDVSDEKKVFKNFINAQIHINEKNNKLKFLKTHSSLAKINGCNFTDLKNTFAAIYIVRDPRNIVSSFAHHYDLNIDEATDVMLDSGRWLLRNELVFKTFLASWNINYNSWKQLKDKVLFIKYEDLITKKKNTLIKIFKFIQKLGAEDFEIDMKKINKVIKSSDFKNMQQLEKKEDFKEGIMDKVSKGRKVFFRLGPENNWRVTLDNKNRIKIETAFQYEMKELGYL
tara:strand:- start:650 stop:1486 length:837 start_codon:yes stop_codon:yes gene_type:complete